MYKIAIIEDDIFQLKQMYETLERYCQEKQLEIQLDQYNHIDQTLFDTKYDAIFLDIVMPESDGITLAKNILEHYEPLFIFITHKSNLMINTFSVHAYDFIPKVNLNERLIPVFEEVIERLAKICQKVSFKTPKGVICCSLKDIIYFEVNDHILSMITRDGTYEYRSSIRSVTNKINNPSFALINQSTYINIECIKNYQHPAITMVNGDVLYVSRNYQKEFKNRMLHYYINLI